MKLETFKKQMADLFVCYNREADENAIKAYWEHLKDFKDRDFIAACDNILKNERFFPTIAVFYNYIDKESEWI